MSHQVESDTDRARARIPVPAEVEDAIEIAAAVCEQLAADGLHVHFLQDPPGPVTAEMHDLEGRMLYPMSLTQTLRLATNEFTP